MVCYQVEEAREQRKRIAADVQGLLGNDGVMMLPTAPGPAPLLKMPADQLNVYRSRLLSLTSIAGLSSLPQVCCACLAVTKLFGGECNSWCGIIFCRQQASGNCGGRIHLRMTATAWLQVTLPVVTVDGCPVGLSMVGPRGSDEQLLALTAKLMPMLAPKIQ